MSFDGALLSQIQHEIISSTQGARIDRIFQPSRDEIILQLRWRGGSAKLLLSAGANHPRIHLTQHSPENPASPPMFCMLLRKHLSSAKWLGMKQVGMDRILFLNFESVNELGDLTAITLVIEIMGRHSNIILLDAQEKIIDSIKRVDLSTSSVRQILPGMLYQLPPLQEKKNILQTSISEIMLLLRNYPKDLEISKLLVDCLQGMSPLPCREIVHRALREDPHRSEMNPQQWSQLEQQILWWQNLLQNHQGTPTMLLSAESYPKDFTYLNLEQYSDQMQTQTFATYSELLDNFYSKKDQSEQIKQRSGDLSRLLNNTHERIIRRIAIQTDELENYKNREPLKIMGELLTANLHLFSKGESHVSVVNYYDPDGNMMDIPLDIRKTPSQNAQHYFSQYRKADIAEKILIEQIAGGKQELEYIETVQDSLERAQGESDLETIRQELASSGYLRRATKKGKQKPIKQTPMQFLSSDGFTILVGRNNLQNDKLTLKDSQKTDIWLHTQKIPGSHTIILTQGQEVPNSTLEEAGILSAYHSQAQNSSKVPVDYTLVKNVKKPNGAKPGMVIYETYQTMIVDPKEEIVKKLSVK